MKNIYNLHDTVIYRRYNTNMQQLTEIAMERASKGIFTDSEVANWVGGSPDRQFGLLRRSFRAGETLRIHSGLYCLSNKYLQNRINPFELAQRIYGPSYISLETALSYHGWIPEAVYTITSTSMSRSRKASTPLGLFSYTRVPQNTFYAEVQRVENDGGGSFLLASPLKALADYVYVHKCDWNGIRPVIESLRVDELMLETCTPEQFDILLDNYSFVRVRRFLNGMRKDLRP